MEPEEAALARQWLGKCFMEKMNKRVKVVGEDTVPRQGYFLLPPFILLKIMKLQRIVDFNKDKISISIIFFGDEPSLRISVSYV